MKDRRSETSRANLGDHIPEALSPEGTVTVAVRLPTETARRLDAARGSESRSAYLRRVITEAINAPT